MNKFAEWMESHDKKQCGVAEKIGVAASTLHAVLRKGQMPSLVMAYEIERYTNGAITIYDWIDQSKQQEM
jgi:transcriptional regulator with XRE-family HTH domain